MMQSLTFVTLFCFPTFLYLLIEMYRDGTLYVWIIKKKSLTNLITECIYKPILINQCIPNQLVFHFLYYRFPVWHRWIS